MGDGGRGGGGGRGAARAGRAARGGLGAGRNAFSLTFVVFSHTYDGLTFLFYRCSRGSTRAASAWTIRRVGGCASSAPSMARRACEPSDVLRVWVVLRRRGCRAGAAARKRAGSFATCSTSSRRSSGSAMKTGPGCRGGSRATGTRLCTPSTYSFRLSGLVAYSLIQFGLGWIDAPQSSGRVCVVHSASR